MLFGKLTVGRGTASVAYTRNPQHSTYEIIPLGAKDEDILQDLVEAESTVRIQRNGDSLVLEVQKWNMGPFPLLVCVETN